MRWSLKSISCAASTNLCLELRNVIIMSILSLHFSTDALVLLRADLGFGGAQPGTPPAS
jgi:hypothetical protein